MSSYFKQVRIAIKDLYLWDENARFPDDYFSKTESELIEYFLSSESRFSMQQFANSIVQDFDLPQLEKLVVLDTNDRFVVLEGNRRLTVYKLLTNPKLASHKKFKEFFQNLKTQVKIDENFELDCLITENVEQALRYIDRKHINRNNEVGWGDAERAHHNQRRGKAKKDEHLKIGINKIVRKLDIPESMKESILGKGFITTFYRILISQPAWDKYGFDLDENNNLIVKEKNFSDLLKIIILNVLQKKDFKGNTLDSRSLNKNEQKESYLSSLKKEDVKKVDEEIIKRLKINFFGDQTLEIYKGKKSSFPKSTDRPHLIPKTCVLAIHETKINNIYLELRDDLLLDETKKAVPNAVGVLFRVFLEINIDYFLKKEGVTLPPEKGLSAKIAKCVEIMESKTIADNTQLKYIRKVGSDGAGILSISNFHEYVHSYKTQPSPSDLKIKWDMLQEFFELLWEYLDKKVNKKKKK